MSYPIFSPTHPFVCSTLTTQKPSQRCLFVFPTLKIGGVVLTCPPNFPKSWGRGGGCRQIIAYVYMGMLLQGPHMNIDFMVIAAR